nr:hypothetical protein B0A51_11243 [Rachicladosporium sp. CCFEE 5018]
MPSIFSRKKSNTPAPTTAKTTREASERGNLEHQFAGGKGSGELYRRESTEQSSTAASSIFSTNTAASSKSASSSPEKKSRTSFVKDRESGKDKSRPKPSKRNSKSFISKSRRQSEDLHPLNLPPDELRRLSRLSAASMSSPQGDSSPIEYDEMDEGTPVPQQQAQTPGAFPQSNGGNAEHVNGEHVNGSEVNGEDGPAPPPHTSPSPPQQQVPEPDPVLAEKCKEAGNKCYKAKQYDQAIEEYTKAIEADPRAATYLSNRAAAFMAASQFIMALDDCKLADELEPDNPKVLHRMAKIYTSLGRPQEALMVYDRIQPPASAKDKAPALQMQSHIAQAEETLKTGTSGSMALHAIDQAERGLGYLVQPPRKWRLLRGEAYLKLGNVNSLGDAQSVAMSLLRSNNADPDALVLRGRALYAQGENEKAIQHFRQALACDPDFRDAVKYLRMVQKLDRMKEEGNAHFKAGRYQRAVDVYTTALDVDPLNRSTNSKILNNRAMCYSKLKQWTNAIDDCDKAIKFDPTYTKARKTRAKALGEGGDWDEAIRALKSIAEENPEEPNIAKDIRNAELELKKSKRKDHYKTLGIEKDADDNQIKRAYRKLAVVHHPDKNPGDAEAEHRFKEIQEAHETLIDPEKRQRYDSGVDLMEPGEGMSGFPGGMGGMGGGGVQIDPEMLFNMMNGGGGGRGGGGFNFGGGGGGNPFGGGGHPFH